MKKLLITLSILLVPSSAYPSSYTLKINNGLDNAYVVSPFTEETPPSNNTPIVDGWVCFFAHEMTQYPMEQLTNTPDGFEYNRYQYYTDNSANISGIQVLGGSDNFSVVLAVDSPFSRSGFEYKKGPHIFNLTISTVNYDYYELCKRPNI